jgi:hypothetical protein
MKGFFAICLVLSETNLTSFFEYELDLFRMTQYSKIPTN